MKARCKDLLNRAVAAMVAAIEVYNKPDFLYRGETFAILAANAWELLLKAKWLVNHDNKITSLYVREGKGEKRKRIKRTKAGNPMTHSLSYLAAKLSESSLLDKNVLVNLEVLEEIRDSAVHFYHPYPRLAERLQEIAMAAVKNFNTAVSDWFKEDLSRFNFYLLPLSFISPLTEGETVTSNQSVENFISFVNEQEQQAGDRESPYMVTVNVELKFVRSKSTTAAPVRVTNDPDAPAVRLTEDQIREKYPWDYQMLTQKCREKYEGFKTNVDYHKLRKKYDSDSRFVYVRRLDPENPKTPTKRFYNPAILREFDKIYSRK